MASSIRSPAETRILKVNIGVSGSFKDAKTLETWELPADTKDMEPLREATKGLRRGLTPIGFPTETVYGLGADATRSDAVKGIYKAKGRPSDNPLIIHICDLTMLRSLLGPGNGANRDTFSDSIPAIYKPLIEKFWPGPLTILLPNSEPSKLAPEVTAGLPTFGVRMPDSPLALSLIHLAGVPLAAPSANASTRPSPTTAAHVMNDLNGKIDIILDGGPCLVGVESTVVDGLCNPPVVLRPGGVSIDRIRDCEGWAGVVRGYKDASELGASAPRAPGMKYKHYSPRARVILYETTVQDRQRQNGISLEDVWRVVDAQEQRIRHSGYDSIDHFPKIGIVSTRMWTDWAGFDKAKRARTSGVNSSCTRVESTKGIEKNDLFAVQEGKLYGDLSSQKLGYVFEVSLGNETKDIARGLFSALRNLDQQEVDVIYVEGIKDEGDIAAAVMNRLRKAATNILS
ncbi:translation initiation protein Sua5 [Diplocarpon rosae]|nr:translation initiation protein Sua5 [Diplocarpon rosae]